MVTAGVLLSTAQSLCMTPAKCRIASFYRLVVNGSRFYMKVEEKPGNKNGISFLGSPRQRNVTGKGQSKLIILKVTIMIMIMGVQKTRNHKNQRLGSGFDDLDPKLSLLCQGGDDVILPCKICGDARYASQDPYMHSLINWLSHSISTSNAIRSTFFLRRTQLQWVAEI